MPDMASDKSVLYDNPMPCLALFFNVIFGVKKLTNFIAAITCPTLANESSFDGWHA